MIGPYDCDHAQREAAAQFDQLRQRAMQGQIWARLTGCRSALLHLAERQKESRLRARVYRGVQLVPLAHIGGSEGRCADFDAAFRPLQGHTRARWISVAVARSRGVALPPVALIEVNGRYFVRDGHHRISVARMLGQLEIEAEVTVWQCAAPPNEAASQASLPVAVGVRVSSLGIADPWLGRIKAWVGNLSIKRQAQAASPTLAPTL